MKKILIVNTIPYVLGGISSVICNYVKYLSKNRDLSFTVTYFGDIESSILEKFKSYGITLIQLPDRGHIFPYMNSLRHVIQTGFDVIHIHGNSGTMYLETFVAKKQVPVILVHNHNTSCNHPFLFGPNSIFVKKIKKYANYLLACSKAAGDWLFGNNYIVINNAIELSTFKFDKIIRERIRAEYDISEDEFLIGNIGIFNQQKNQMFLIEVFNAYLMQSKKCKLMLIGSGPLREVVENKVEELNLRDKVIFVDANSDVQVFYNAFDLFVLPSKWEGLPLVNIEAQTNGLPCLVSSVVTDDACVSNRFFKFDLSYDVVQWCEQIDMIRALNLPRDEDMFKAIRKNGFDLAEQVETLQRIYMS